MQFQNLKFLMVTMILLLIVAGCIQKSKFDGPFVIHKGTNIAHWLSQSERRGAERAAWFTKKDVVWLAELGCDHIRLPIDEMQLWDEKNNRIPEAFALMNQAIDWCAEYGLRVIVDLHIVHSHHFNEGDKPLWTDPAAQERLLQIWRELSAVLKNRPNGLVAYEILNEAVADDPDDWNKLLARVAALIRETEPERTIVIGSNRWQTPDNFPFLKIPENDPNILLSFHDYTPLVFTHYKAGWNKVGEYTGPVKYPGQIIEESDLKGLPDDLVAAINRFNGFFNRDTLAAGMMPAIEYAKAHNLPLYCGEWGVLQTLPEPDRMRWYADMLSIFEEHNIAWATWNFKSSEFGFQYNSGAPDSALIKTVFPKAEKAEISN